VYGTLGPLQQSEDSIIEPLVPDYNQSAFDLALQDFAQISQASLCATFQKLWESNVIAHAADTGRTFTNVMKREVDRSQKRLVLVAYKTAGGLFEASAEKTIPLVIPLVDLPRHARLRSDRRRFARIWTVKLWLGMDLDTTYIITLVSAIQTVLSR
jgi:hypothetical protein